MAELMVVVALGVLLLFAMQQAVTTQRRYWAAQGGASARHEAVRIAMAVLTGALREASLARGDVVILAPSRIRARMPLGLAQVCGTDLTGGRLGLVRAEGRWAALAGDSILVPRAGGWTAEAVTALSGPTVQVPCVPVGGTVASLGRPALDAMTGAAARPFRSVVFELALDAGAPWLFRVDGAQRDAVAGPLDATAGFTAWYENAAGAVVATPASAARVVVRVVTAPASGTPAGSRRDTVTLSFGGRNR
ncbi:MAG TPA: hypothetical protein VLH75_09970 [Longimicrobiales bacterium]|nr:hypothetical protein [Longimicrobiales bacterium]